MRFFKKTLNTILKYDEKGFSMIEVIVVIALAGFALFALSSLFLGTNLTKNANENLLLASNLASDVMEHLKKTSINYYNRFEDLLESLNTKTIDFDDIFSVGASYANLYDDTIPNSFNTLPDSLNQSYIYFEALDRDHNNKATKILIKVVVKWKEFSREQNNEQEYSVATFIIKNGLGYFLK
ncbi:type IV pilus modification PilV family protein [Atribacter laminatus]|uniref:Prepilin-type N-terminal cleavage/methylation domain-containing protein n=1 Tax=Atribacter laminatus TaxID=2847778 RepID=A0A7T1F297_ATRLM|nr:type II secretion system protein [Atribacter laminatus]QPM67045.1 hypothetical protein RT761_00233 [Atribacter laminatus]